MSELSEKWRKPKPGDNMSSLAERVRCADELDARDRKIVEELKQFMYDENISTTALEEILKKLGGQQ